MSGETTVQALSATSTGAAVVLLPATSGSTALRLGVLLIIGVGVAVFVSLTASRIYRAVAK